MHHAETKFAKKLWGGQTLLFTLWWHHHVHSTIVQTNLVHRISNLSSFWCI